MNSENWFSQIKEDVLWHYTDVDALKSIITDDLKLFSTSQKNDKFESQFGRDIFDKALLGLYHLIGFSELKKEISDIHFYEKMTKSSFIFSMTTNRDSACFWQTYAKNKNGIAIGINASLLKNKLKKYIKALPELKLQYNGKPILGIKERLHLNYCIYNEDEIFANALKYASEFFALQDEISDRDLVIIQLMFLREEISYCYKHPSFLGENEVRISCWNPTLTEQSEKKLFPVKDMISEIIVSPVAKDFVEVKDQIKNIIGNLNIKISESQCPLWKKDGE